MKEVLQKMESWCAYQDRCHKEVREKLFAFPLSREEKEEVITALIAGNFLNEERFARSYARGKHRIKGYGRNRITQELKARDISPYLIRQALTEIDPEEYDKKLEQLAEKIWDATSISDKLKKRKKCCDYLLRKGYESDLVYEAIRALEKA